MKISNVLFSGLVFLLVGCGTTGTDPAAGLPNGGMLEIPQNNQGQDVQNKQITIDGIWYLFYGKTADNNIDIKTVSDILEFDTQGQIYDISGQKSKIGTYTPISNTKIKLVGTNTENIIEFLEIANEEGNCFYTTRFFSNNTQQKELWCKKIGTGDTQTTQGGDVRPSILRPEGYIVDLKDYLYPSFQIINENNILQDVSKISEDIYNYEKKEDGSLVYNGKITKKLQKVIDPQNNIVIQEFINNSVQPKKEDIIYNDKIDSYAGLALESYPARIQKNSILTEVSDNGIDLRCVVQDIIGGFEDLSDKIPQDIQNHLKQQVTGSTFKNNQFTYTGVIHIRCGTTNGATIDSYNVNGMGEVLSIYSYADNTSRYEILDKFSIQN